ncbi:predicted protein [Naegleria gruberi]|uniref:Predicted protein n=1 Tax=Naegleria gruberi TaxID=5762 RepID=D2V1V1_NAEGR|nr:uncharacterized protein NAEGRDRAFT_62705 [Naegleria gruberi]EFC49373.1 predicted protein [Naegleria gruberi]|eukprot:XP_002682117.1 predicted protein [Naegleria gruberi strain NEG-M]
MSQQHITDTSTRRQTSSFSSSLLSDHSMIDDSVTDEMEVTLSCLNYGVTTTLLQENSDIESTRQFLMSEVIDDPNVDRSKFVIVFHDIKTNKDIKITSNTQYRLLWKKLLLLPPEQREIDLMDRDQYITSVNQTREYFFSPTTSRSFSTPMRNMPVESSLSQSPYSNSQHSIPMMPPSISPLSPPQTHLVRQSPIQETSSSQQSNSNTTTNNIQSPVIHASVKTRTKKRQARPTISITPETKDETVPPTVAEDSQEIVSPSTSVPIVNEIQQQPQEEVLEPVPVKSRQGRRQKVKIEPVEDSQDLVVKTEEPLLSEDEIEIVPKKQRQARRKTIAKLPVTEREEEQEKHPFESSLKKQKSSPKIFNQNVEVFSRKQECDTIINFIQNCYEDFNPQKNVLFIYGTNGQGKTMVTTSVFDASCLEKYQLNLAGSEKASDLIYRLYEKVYTRSTDSTKKQERITKLLEYFNKKHTPALILLDEFSYSKHNKYLEQIRVAKVIILAITNDPPKNPGINFLAFNQYEQDDITSILVHEYKHKISADMIQKMMGLLKNKHDMRQIKSFVETHLIPIAHTLDTSKLIKLVNTQFSRKLDILKGLGQTTIEVLVILCCVASEKEKFNGEITSEEFRRKYEEILDDDFRSNFTEIADSTEKLAQENYIVKQGITGDIVLNIAPDLVLSSDNKTVKKILSNRK